MTSFCHMLLLLPLQSDPSIIFVESSEGDSLGLITNKAQLDQLIISLNKKGAREAALHQALTKHYSKFCRCLRPPAQPLDMRQVPRNRLVFGLRRCLQVGDLMQRSTVVYHPVCVLVWLMGHMVHCPAVLGCAPPSHM